MLTLLGILITWNWWNYSSYILYITDTCPLPETWQQNTTRHSQSSTIVAS